MEVWKTNNQLRQARAATSGRLALVPTMGALHQGHLSLVEHAKTLADQVWVTIFVNPTQFGPNEDFARYPRPLEDDLQKCEQAGVAGVFVPEVEEIYPAEGVLDCVVDVPELTLDLEATQRPGHFQGVCRVVAKLLNLAQPHLAVFGQKDYQQWRVIEAMVADLLMPIEIIASPTVREEDGLAMSSRNRYLTAEQRQQALGLYQALTYAKQQLQAGQHETASIEQGMNDIIQQAGLTTDYATLRHPKTLQSITLPTPQVAALVAGRLGQVRLLDNLIIDL